MSNQSPNPLAASRPWSRGRLIEWVAAGSLLLVFALLRRTKSYLLAHFGDDLGRIVPASYATAYEVAFHLFLVLVLIYFLWSVLERKNLVLLTVGALVISGLVVYQAASFSRDALLGDRSARRNSLVVPRYDFLRIRESPHALEFRAVGRPSSDFAQVYFPARDELPLSSAFDAQTTDPWHRPSRYPPWVVFACSITFCRLSFGEASLIHLGLQIALLLASLTVAQRSLRISRFTPPVVLLVAFCLFLTPVGLSWFERGQFSIHVGLGYLWLILGLLKKNRAYLVLAGLFSFVKWTRLPGVFVILATFVGVAVGVQELRRRLWLVLPYGAVLAALFAAFPREGLRYVDLLVSQEMRTAARGISLSFLLPEQSARLLLPALTLIGIALLRRRATEQQIPFFVGVGILMTAMPRTAFDYAVPGLLAFLPFMLYWSSLPARLGRLRRFACYGYLLFLLAASYSIRILVTEPNVALLYLVTGIALILVAFVSPDAAQDQPAAIPP